MVEAELRQVRQQQESCSWSCGRHASAAGATGSRAAAGAAAAAEVQHEPQPTLIRNRAAVETELRQ
eukprot:12936556-Alexandrium_andersonii.AAC.1